MPKHKICVHGKENFLCRVCSFGTWIKHNILDKTKKVGIKDINDLGCSTLDMKKYLEDQFDENINWDTYNITWRIRFEKPINQKGISEEEIRKRIHYTNIKPTYIRQYLPPRNITVNDKEYNLNLIFDLIRRDSKLYSFREVIDNVLYFDRLGDSYCQNCERIHGGNTTTMTIDKYDGCFMECNLTQEGYGKSLYIGKCREKKINK